MESHGLLVTPLTTKRDCLRGKPTDKQSAAITGTVFETHSMCYLLNLGVHKLTERQCFLHFQKQTPHYVMGS